MRNEVNDILDLSKLVEDNRDYLFRFAFFRVGDRQDAEDIVQCTFLRYFEKDCGAVATDKARMYLFRTVYNMCVDYQRKTKTELPIDSEVMNVVDESDADSAMYQEYGRISEILANIPEREAEVIRMRAVDELSFVEISHVLDTPVTTVKSRYKSGMEKLKSIVKPLN